MKKNTFGIIIGNRGFFPDALAKNGRKNIIASLKKLNCNTICLSEKDTKSGAVESYTDAVKCAKLFKRNADKIDGIIVSLPNFGDEKGVANAIRLSGLDVPILVHAEPDDEKLMKITHRRDSFCGKISVCNNLRQYGLSFTLTQFHTEAVNSEIFAEDIKFFAAVCRIVKGIKNTRVGAIGARPAAFNTVRYSEKILEREGITVETIDLSEIFGLSEKVSDKDKNKKLKEISEYTNCAGVPKSALNKIAKFGVVIENWMNENCIDVSAIQCWTSMEEFFGIAPCTIMSMMSNKLIPSACEVDVCGALSMYAMTLAAGSPSALTDWNNNYGDDIDKCVLFHCSNFPKKILKNVKMDYQAIIAGSVGAKNAYGTCVGRIKKGNFTFTRVTTDDTDGVIKAYTGEGEMTDDPLNTFGGFGVAKIPDLPVLLDHICREGFEHHVAINFSEISEAIAEAFDNYLGWETYLHN